MVSYNDFDCIKCSLKYECQCPDCVWFYVDHYDRNMSCSDIVIQDSCHNYEYKMNCNIYNKIDWITKIKYGKKLVNLDKIRDKIYGKA